MSAELEGRPCFYVLLPLLMVLSNGSMKRFHFCLASRISKGHISLSLSLSLSLYIYIYIYTYINLMSVIIIMECMYFLTCLGDIIAEGEAHAKPEINAILFLYIFTLKLCDLLTLSSLSYSTCLLFHSDGDLSFMWEGPFMICTGSLSELMGPLGFTCFTRAPPPKSQDLSVCVNRGGQRWFSVLFVSLVHDSMVHTLSTKPMWIWWAFKESH